MNIVIRVDSSAQIGSGHLVRCRTLAEELRSRGANVRFICREHQGHLIEWLGQSAFAVKLLPAATKPQAIGEDYEAWLGVTQEQDAAETIEALGETKPDWLIVDHYGLDQAWEKLLRPHVEKIFVIDDLANRIHDCDGLLDQNESLEGESRYVGLVPKYCRVLAGCRYALLRPEYAEYRKTLKPRTGEINRIFIFFGGTDPDNMTGIAIAALSNPEFKEIILDVVIGATNPHQQSLELQAVERGNVNIYGSRPHLADLMAEADLAIGAGGTTTWERCCLGLPSIAVSLANNQRDICTVMDQLGVIHYLESAETITIEYLQTVLRGYYQSSDELLSLSLNSYLLVDGLGCKRITEWMIPSRRDNLFLKEVVEEDCFTYYEWVNDPEVRSQSLQREHISWQSHLLWFQQKIRDENCYMSILFVENLPIGQIRFDVKNNTAIISYSLDIIVRGRGLSTDLIKMGLNHLKKEPISALRAIVKTQNIPSRKVFERLGFKQSESADKQKIEFSASLSELN